MKQMVAPQAPVVRTMTFGELAQGFFRMMWGQGEVFFGFDRGSRSPTYHFPVLEDGSISNRGGRLNIYPNETIHVIHPSDLGIKELKWTEERASA